MQYPHAYDNIHTKALTFQPLAAKTKIKNSKKSQKFNLSLNQIDFYQSQAS
jgi:hypothetical protein